MTNPLTDTSHPRALPFPSAGNSPGSAPPCESGASYSALPDSPIDRLRDLVRRYQGQPGVTAYRKALRDAVHAEMSGKGV